MINRLPWRKKLRTSAANNLDKINEIIDYINHSDISPVALSESGSGRSVTIGTSSSIKSLDVHGESIQDGTPAPDAPVEVQVVETPDGGQFGILIGDTVTPIDLQGNFLASLPDGTRDELVVDSAGHVTLEKHVGTITTPTDVTSVLSFTEVAGGARWNIAVDGLASEEIPQGSTNGYCDHAPFSRTLSLGTLGSHVFTFGNKLYYVIEGSFTNETAAAWINAHQMTVVYPLATPQTIDLGYMDMPSIESGDAISVSASIVPMIDTAWWCYDDVTDIIRDLKAYVDYKTAGLGMSRPDNISLNTQANQPAIVEESEMI